MRRPITPFAMAILAVAGLAAAPKPLAQAPAPGAQPPPAAPAEKHPSAADLELLLSGDEVSPAAAATAVSICRRIAADYDDRDIARFLNQYGRALAHSGDPDAGVVMLARAFILFPESRWAPASLLDSARFHRQYYRDEATVERLARRAARSARAMGLRELADEADAFLAAPAPPTPSNASPRPIPSSDPT
ncbi:MAG: hypothetical protein ACO396_06625, partial [Phycisphaerales bacterium]